MFAVSTIIFPTAQIINKDKQPLVSQFLYSFYNVSRKNGAFSDAVNYSCHKNLIDGRQ